MMNFAPLYDLIQKSAAPPHAKEVMRGLLLCTGTRRVCAEHFRADLDLQALADLKLITWQAGGLAVTKKAYKLAGMKPPRTLVVVANVE